MSLILSLVDQDNDGGMTLIDDMAPPHRNLEFQVIQETEVLAQVSLVDWKLEFTIAFDPTTFTW